MEKLKYRMYFLVMYNLSPIQQGIQAGHVSLEYVDEYGDTKEYKDFFENDKTWIVLNGGTSNDMLQHYSYLNNELEINVSFFLEPDLNESMSAICFLADERIWDKEKYPDFLDYCDTELKNCIHPQEPSKLLLGMSLVYDPIEKDELYKKWVESIGGETNAKLREFLKNKRLA